MKTFEKKHYTDAIDSLQGDISILIEKNEKLTEESERLQNKVDELLCCNEILQHKIDKLETEKNENYYEGCQNGELVLKISQSTLAKLGIEISR